MRWLWIALGGAGGTLLRYSISLVAPRFFGTSFPAGTLIVNLLGSFCIGAIMFVGLTTKMISADLRFALTTGVMGGLTTYSTFNYETIELVRSGAWGIGILNCIVTFVGCLAAGLLGLAVGKLIAGA
jgi:CrcB protein